MAVLKTLKITGRQSASTDGSATLLLTTKTITIDDDGFLTFTDANSIKRRIPLIGDFAILMREVLQGTGGYAAADWAFNRPKVTGPGVGGRVDP